MRYLHTLIGVSAIAALSACASTGESGPVFADDTDCFFTRTVSDWRALDDRNLVVFTGRRNPYHVQLSMPTTQLRSQETIAFSDRDGRICPYGGDAVLIGGTFPERVTISSIRRLSEGELEEVYLQYGIRRPAIAETSEEPVQ